MALAGNKPKLYALQSTHSAAAPTTVGAFTQVLGMDSFTLNENRVTLERTSFGDTARQHFQGLKEGSGSLSGYWIPTDGGQAEIKDAFDGDDDDVCYFLIAFTGDPSDGTLMFKTVIPSFSRESAVDDRINLSVEFTLSGAVVAGPTS